MEDFCEEEHMPRLKGEKFDLSDISSIVEPESAVKEKAVVNKDVPRPKTRILVPVKSSKPKQMPLYKKVLSPKASMYGIKSDRNILSNIKPVDIKVRHDQSQLLSS